MVGRVVDRVDADCVDAELRELCDVALAAGSVGNGVLGLRGATRLVVDTTNVETLVASKERCERSVRACVLQLACEVRLTISLDSDGGDGTLLDSGSGCRSDRCHKGSGDSGGLHSRRE